MTQTFYVAVMYLLVFYSALWAQIQVDPADSIPADTLYDPEYYSDSDERSIKEYREPEEIENDENAKLMTGLGPYPIHTVLVGPCLGYIYYDEIFKIKDMRELAAMNGSTLNEIIGEPKSTEYGLCPGISFQYRYIGKNVPLFISIPKISFLFGIGNTYDGSYSEQDSISPDTFNVRITPASFQKMNFFFEYGFDLGYLFVINKFRLSFFSGIDGRVWIRDLVERSEVPEGLHVTDNERYSWVYIPLHATFSFQPTNKFSIGAEAGVNFMIYGSMQINRKISDDYGNSLEWRADLVTISNKIGYHIALLLEPRFSQKKGLKISPYIQWYSFGKSTIGAISVEQERGHFYEPSSNTIRGGVNFTIAVFPQEKKVAEEE